MAPKSRSTSPAASAVRTAATRLPAESTGQRRAATGRPVLSVAVTPRQPQLVWHGMEHQSAVTAVKTQVLEIIHPGLCTADSPGKPGTPVRPDRNLGALPQNRLIWTRDNLVALRTLLDERDAVTGEYRYRGQVDLIYIDPPFMVNSDFHADNPLDSADLEAGVELIAYRDTWRQGLDSFLTMLRQRLELLRELLKTTGSIYVHLDWHAVHYVKVIMDDLFGYTNFRNEIIWHYYNKFQGNINRLPSNHDTILCYAKSPAAYFHSLREPRDRPERQLRRVWNKDSGRIVNAKDQFGKVILQEVTDKRVDDVWRIPMLQPADHTENIGYPTQKRRSLLERIIEASCPPGGLILDCFLGSGTTIDAAERLGRHWIGVDHGKYAIQVARKRLIHLQGKKGSPEKALYTYVECDKCKHIDRKERKTQDRSRVAVAPFTVENLGVYQQAAQGLELPLQGSAYRDELMQVFGGEVTGQEPLLHGKKGHRWVHIGTLTAPIASPQVWSIARAAQHTDLSAVTILSVYFDPLSAREKAEIQSATGITVSVRIIPTHAIEEVRRRLQLRSAEPAAVVESMAIPAFYAPLAVSLHTEVQGDTVHVSLQRCEVDIESFLASQRPLLKAITPRMSPSVRKKAQAAQEKWSAREQDLNGWLAQSASWQKFVDYWAIDRAYGRRLGEDGNPIFETDWQSFRPYKGKGQPMTFSAALTYSAKGPYRVAARVTDVFGNDGLATAEVQVG